MNEHKEGVTPESKMAAIKTLAIVGFITAIAFGVWAAVQVVRFAPSAWNSLASMAETVYGKNVILSVSAEKDIVNSGESFKVSFNDIHKKGAYSFSFECVDGVAAEVRDMHDAIVAVSCDTPITLSSERHETDVAFTSEKSRFADVSFSIRFTAAGNAAQSQEKSYSVTVVNATVAETSDEVVTNDDTAFETPTPEPTPETPEPTPAPTPSEGGTPAPTPMPKPAIVPKPVVRVPVIVSGGPVSNPYGFTDLSVSALTVGTYNKDTHVFTPKTSLDNDANGALRFSVQNIGTKTSDEWTYRVTFPGDNGVSYTSGTQKPLSPTEKATVMIAFGSITDETGTEEARVEIRTSSDSRSSNDTAELSVKITN